MGLLDDVLGQLAGGASNRGALEPEPRATRGAGMAPIAMALLPVVLAMLRNRQQGPSLGVERTSAAGGLGGILGQILGGGGGASGGLGGLLEHLQRSGLGDQARSWVGTGDNQPISPNDISQVFGADGLAEIARRAGLGEDDAARGLAQLMPEVVDRLTPEGRVPDDSSLMAGVESFARRLGVS